MPIIDDEQHGYRRVNVTDQLREPNSLLNWIERRVRARKGLPEIGWGDCSVLESGAPQVLVLRYTWRNTALIVAHNFSEREQIARFDVGTDDGGSLFDIFDENHSEAGPAGKHELRMRPYGHGWFRVGAPDTVPARASMD